MVGLHSFTAVKNDKTLFATQYQAQPRKITKKSESVCSTTIPNTTTNPSNKKKVKIRGSSGSELKQTLNEHINKDAKKI